MNGLRSSGETYEPKPTICVVGGGVVVRDSMFDFWTERIGQTIARRSRNTRQLRSLSARFGDLAKIIVGASLMCRPRPTHSFPFNHECCLRIVRQVTHERHHFVWQNTLTKFQVFQCDVSTVDLSHRSTSLHWSTRTHCVKQQPMAPSEQRRTTWVPTHRGADEGTFVFRR